MVDDVRIVRRQADRRVPLKAVLHVAGAQTDDVLRIVHDLPHLPGGAVHAADAASVRTGVDDVGIARIDGNVSALTAAYGGPVLQADATGSRPTGQRDGGVVLLAAIQTVGKLVVYGHAVHLGGGLIELR